MPVDRAWRWRFGPEWALGVVAALAFLGFLGSTELWGKREQRAAAEAVDTVARSHWLVGEIQGRPRLEKPPLPRWITAGLIRISGRADEVIVRLPNPLAALALVALVYAWGRSIGGRGLGLASGFALASTAFFIVEMRQAGNDGFLTLFTALSLFAASRRWGFDRDDEPGSKRWNLVFFAAMGLGFLTKGPVIFLWVGLPTLGYLATSRRVASGLRLLVDGRGLILLVGLVAVWPVAVMLRYAAAWGVWWLEIGQKTGALGVEHGNTRGSILLDAMGMTLPWTPLALVALLTPIRRWRQAPELAEASHPNLSLAWWWAFGPLAVLGTWDVAKPNYYLPALPAVAVLVGDAWIRLARLAREVKSGSLARVGLQIAWSGLFASAVLAPVVANELAPSWLGWSIVASLALGVATLASAWLWQTGRDSISLAATASGLIVVTLIAYGAIAPGENAARGHRALASELGTILPPGTSPWFFDDLDEGVWFYGPTLNLKPVPPLTPSVPRSNRGHALRSTAQSGQNRAEVANERTRQAIDQLNAWASQAGPNAFILIRGKLLDRLGDQLPSKFAPMFREAGVKRNEVVLIRVRTEAELAALSASTRR